MGITSEAAGAWFVAGQVQPVSMVHVGLQPSPAMLFPSSHCSCGNLSPSPHTAVQVPPWHLGSTVHVALQPSFGVVFPSSHCSVPAMIPSPHFLATHRIPGEVHCHPASSW